jgi:hypothetical protein
MESQVAAIEVHMTKLAVGMSDCLHTETFEPHIIAG